jgi:uncharacterized membrane protein YdjX (TVP38/TMEM64 family)
LAGAGILALIVDILLPVPSSMVGTLLGTKFAWPAAVFLIWLGLMLGATVGFALARWLGAPLVQRMCSSDDQQRLQDLAANHGTKALVLTRALPILAEATVLMFGAAKLPWRQFWPAVTLANLGLAIAYATLGWLGQTEGAAMWALYASVLIPLTATFATRWWWPVSEPRDYLKAADEPPAPKG